jgi:uncharacterized lipoprotein YajG
MKMKWLAVVLGLAMFAGCSTTSVGLKYAPNEAAIPGKVAASVQPVSVGTFLDNRNETSTWLGSVRGGFGNPIKTLESSQPVADVVQAAYIDALKAKGITIDSSASLQLSGTVRALHCTQMAHREATAEIEIVVVDKVTGQKRLTQTYSAKTVNDSGVARGVFASVEELRLVLEKTMRDVIDKTLGDASFIAALSPAQTSKVSRDTVAK